jgi:hypothetical protein
MTADRLFDPGVERAIEIGSLFDREELTELQAINDQATDADRAAVAALNRKDRT